MVARFAWLTPDLPPTEDICRVLVLPSDANWLAVLSGAIIELTNPANFEQFGSASPEDCATVFSIMFDKFSNNEGVCRVIGEIITWAGSTSPDTKWLLCDGSSLVRADYSDLFTVIGTTYGAADGTHFNLPDMRSRSPIGAGTGTGLSTYGLGSTGGEETHTLNTGETPIHSHSDTGHTHGEGSALPAVGAAIVGVPIPSAIPSPSVTGLGFASLSNTGGGGSHNNLPPYIALNYLIVALQ
jgi:microcystin-dependent protein